MTNHDTPARQQAPETIAASHGIAADAAYGSVAPPLYLTTTYERADFERAGRYAYGRGGNPNRDTLSAALAELEGGAGGVITASGMAALDLLLTQLEPDAHVIVPHDCYGGTLRLVNGRAARHQFRLSIVDLSDEEALLEACHADPTLVLIETPSNPLMRVTDIAHVAGIAKEAGAKVMVDNTFLSPALQRPLSLGADYALHSTTKYINGHSDVVGGALIAASAEDADALRVWANTTGCTGAPFDAWLTLRGLRTLFPRIERASRTAAALAEWLEAQPAVSAVHYPGLASHPGHELAARQQRGFGAMLSFDLTGGLDAVRRFVSHVGVATLAESLGGIETLISHPATMTHASMEEAAKRRAGIGDGLLRMSVGLEHQDDLIEGMRQGLASL